MPATKGTWKAKSNGVVDAKGRQIPDRRPPEMLEGCKLAYHRLRSLGRAEDGELADLLQSIIAKAEGGAA